MGDLEPARGNLHVCKFLRDLTNIKYARWRLEATICSEDLLWSLLVETLLQRSVFFSCYPFGLLFMLLLLLFCFIFSPIVLLVLIPFSSHWPSWLLFCSHGGFLRFFILSTTLSPQCSSRKWSPPEAVGRNSSNKPDWLKLAIPSFRVREPNSTRAKDKARKSVTITVENTAKEPRRVRKGPGGQICRILQRQWDFAHPGTPSKTRTQNRLSGGDGFKIKAARRTKEGRVWESVTKSRRLMPILLQKEFRDIGRPAPFQRPSCQGCLEQYYNKVLPTAAGIPRHP